MAKRPEQPLTSFTRGAHAVPGVLRHIYSLDALFPFSAPRQGAFHSVCNARDVERATPRVWAAGEEIFGTLTAPGRAIAAACAEIGVSDSR